MSLKSALWLALLVAPLGLGLAWGTHFGEGPFVAFRYARNLGAGRELAHDLQSGWYTPPHSPLWVLALALPARLGIALPQAGLVLSSLGWGAAALAAYRVGAALQRPLAATVSSVLLALSPLVVATLGTEIPWAAAWALIAVAATIRRQWNVQAGALALMICTHVDLSTVTTAALLLALQWTASRRCPWWQFASLTAATIGWGLAASCGFVAPFSGPSLDWGEWTGGVRQLAWESEFYGLFLPFVGLGALAVPRRSRWAGLLGTAVLAVSSGPVARAMIAVLALILAGLGVDWLVEWIEARQIVRLSHRALAVSLALVVGLPLSVAEASSLVQRYTFRPVVQHELERRAGHWLVAHSQPAATVLGPDRVGYLADRPTLAWDGTMSDLDELARLLRTLNADPPHYCVSSRSVAWDRVTRTAWFQDSYDRLGEFASPYDAASPFIVWGYRYAAFEMGARQALSVHLPGSVDLVGHAYGPDRIQSGDAVVVTLYLSASHPVTESYRAVVRVISPLDGIGWAQRDTRVSPTAALAEWWQAGQPVAQRLLLTTAHDIPVGAYDLEVFASPADSSGFLPLYRSGDPSPVERITLGYVVVPWRGDVGESEPLEANFADQITLLGFEAGDDLIPGAEFDVKLYWEAQRPPEDDYVVFVHLLDAAGQLVAGHDAPPMAGRYPTRAWVPGEIVPDVHHLTLAPDAAAGTYELRVGLYSWPGLERLPAWDSQGVEYGDRAALLKSVRIH